MSQSDGGTAVSEVSTASATPSSAASSSIATAAELKAAGNALFASGQYDRAIAKWSQAQQSTHSVRA